VFDKVEHMAERSPSPQRRFWTSKEAANHLQVSVESLYAYCKGNKTSPGKAKLIGSPPPFRRFGRNCIRFPIAEFIQWAETWDTPGAQKDA
jgi:hypothetical protein